MLYLARVTHCTINAHEEKEHCSLRVLLVCHLAVRDARRYQRAVNMRTDLFTTNIRINE